jgi:TPP-dependent 2-oxoacid decarboxylase
MTTYPIAIELTAWVELGLNQYEVTLEEVSKVTVKRTDDVLHSRELTASEVDSLIKAIQSVTVPVTQELPENPNHKPVSSYELIIESAHFSLEYNWEDVDAQSSKAFNSVIDLAKLIEGIGKF